jgi:hypothetical protein
MAKGYRIWLDQISTSYGTQPDDLSLSREQILKRRKEVRIQTVNHRRDYNQAQKELVHTA